MCKMERDRQPSGPGIGPNFRHDHRSHYIDRDTTMTRIFVVLATILLATSAGAASTTSMNVDITVTHAGSPVQTLIPVIQPAGTVFQFVAGAGSANRELGDHWRPRRRQVQDQSDYRRRECLQHRAQLYRSCRGHLYGR